MTLTNPDMPEKGVIFRSESGRQRPGKSNGVVLSVERHGDYQTMRWPNLMGLVWPD